MSLPYDEATIREALEGEGMFSTCFTYGVVNDGGDARICDVFAAFDPTEIERGEHHEVIEWFQQRDLPVQQQEHDRVAMWYVEAVTPQQAFEFSLRWCGAPYEPDAVRCVGT